MLKFSRYVINNKSKQNDKVTVYKVLIEVIAMNRCGKCQQFTRTPDNLKDICGAWEQPTTATRDACEYFIPKKKPRKSEESN